MCHANERASFAATINCHHQFLPDTNRPHTTPRARRWGRHTTPPGSTTWRPRSPPRNGGCAAALGGDQAPPRAYRRPRRQAFARDGRGGGRRGSGGGRADGRRGREVGAHGGAGVLRLPPRHLRRHHAQGHLRRRCRHAARADRAHGAGRPHPLIAHPPSLFASSRFYSISRCHKPIAAAASANSNSLVCSRIGIARLDLI